jgi:signal transduction histidine kinase
MRSPMFWERRLPFSFAYFLIGWGLWWALLARHLTSTILAPIWYVLVFVRLPIRWAIGSAAITTAILATAIYLQVEGATAGAALTIGAILLAFALVLGLFIHGLITQSMRRQKLLEELRDTQRSLAQAERRAGVLEERQRLAREIHDTLAQDFTSILMHLSAAQIGLERGREDILAQVLQAERTARSGLEEARRLVWALRPEVLERQTLAEGIHRLAKQWTESVGVPAQLSVTGSPRPLLPEVEAAVLRSAQEALHNVQKHARARRVTLTLSYMSDLIALDVQDDGVGFAPGAAPSGLDIEGGFGLRGLRERLERLRGRLIVESEPGRGTTVAVSIPLLADAATLEAGS